MSRCGGELASACGEEERSRTGLLVCFVTLLLVGAVGSVELFELRRTEVELVADMRAGVLHDLAGRRLVGMMLAVGTLTGRCALRRALSVRVAPDSLAVGGRSCHRGGGIPRAPVDRDGHEQLAFALELEHAHRCRGLVRPGRRLNCPLQPWPGK